MKPIKQTLDFSVCLNGYTLPKYSLYGNIYGTIWYCTQFTPVNGAYQIHVLKNTHTSYWESTNTREYGAIYVRIRDFMKSGDFINHNVVPCPHKREKASIMYRAAKNEEARLARKAAQQFREDMEDAPRMKKAQGEFVFRCRPQGGNIDYEYMSGMDLTGYVGAESVTGKIDFNKPYFEQGQTTSGETGDYTRSGFETKDGMKTCFKSYRPENKKPKIAGKVAKEGAAMKSAKIKRALSDSKELEAYLVNEQNIDKKVITAATSGKYNISARALSKAQAATKKKEK